MLEIDWYTSSWFLGTYVLGTYLGYRFANRKAMDVIAHTIESLRKGGYIKVKYSGVNRPSISNLVCSTYIPTYTKQIIT